MTGKERDRIKREIAYLEKIENNAFTAKIYLLIAGSIISLLVVCAIALNSWPESELTAASLLVIAIAGSAILASIAQHAAKRKLSIRKRRLRSEEDKKQKSKGAKNREPKI